MNPIIKNILAVIAGLVLGNTVNMGLIMISGSIIPLPYGADNTTMEGLAASMHLFEPKHFIFPFLAHALGTFTGAFLTFIIAANHKMRLALVIALFFLAGGIYMVFILPSPLWFNALDVIAAYFPMAILAAILAEKVTKIK